VIIIEGSNNTTTDTIEKPPAVDSTVDTGNKVRYPGIMLKRRILCSYSKVPRKEF